MTRDELWLLVRERKALLLATHCSSPAVFSPVAGGVPDGSGLADVAPGVRHNFDDRSER